MNDFAFLDNMPSAHDQWVERLKKHEDDTRREFFKRRLQHIADDCEKAQEHCRALMKAGADVTEELKEMESIGYAMSLVAMLLKREQSNG